MIALIVLQVAHATEADQCYSVLLVGGIILILMLIKAFGHHVGRWDGPPMRDKHDFQQPNRRGED